MDLIEIDITENLETVEVSVQEGSIVVSGAGEVNTSSSAGGTSLVLAKSGVDLPFKGLTAGTNITFGVGATALTINASSPITASNGLTKTVNDIALGGTLTANTTLLGTNQTFGITTSAKITFSDVLDNNEISLDYNNNLITLSIGAGTPNVASLLISDSSITLTDEHNSKGIVYAGAYKANFTTYSLVDKDYVDTEISALSSDNIQDAAGTTGLFTEETADRLVGHSANTGTSLIFEMFEGTGTPVSVFQVDGNGSLLYNNVEYLSRPTRSVIIGSQYASGKAPGIDNYLIGFRSGYSINASAAGNVSLGAWCTSAMTTGAYNTFIGNQSGRSITSQNRNVCIGSSAGRFNVSNDMLFIDGTSVGRTNAATELTDSLIVGTFNATKANQTLQVNGKFTASHDCINIDTSKTPATAGATGTAGDVCWDASYIYVCTATDTWERAAIATW